MIGLALAAALAGPAIVESCDWANPGQSPYTGTTTAAIMAMPLPLDVRQRLAARPLDSYDHFVVVDRDSIRTTGAEFAPDIAFLNFGTGRRVCAGVDRRSWKADHVETAIVYCDAISGWCVGKFAVCGNWAIFTRRDAPPVAPPVAVIEALPPTVVPVLPVLPVVPLVCDCFAPNYYAENNYFYGGAYGGGYGGGGYGGGGYGGGGSSGQGPGVVLPGPPPIPEPATVLLICAGLAGIFWRKRHG